MQYAAGDGEALNPGDKGGESVARGVEFGVNGQVEALLFAAGEAVVDQDSAHHPEGGADIGALKANPVEVFGGGAGQAGGVAEEGGDLVPGVLNGSVVIGEAGAADGLEEGERGIVEETSNAALLFSVDVPIEVVKSFGQDGDDVLDFLFEAIVGAGGKFEEVAGGVDGNVFDGDGAGEPTGHDGCGAGEADPTGVGGGKNRNLGDQIETPANFSDNLAVAVRSRGNFARGSGLEKFALVGRAAGKGEVAEMVPDLVPGNPVGGIEAQRGRTHGFGQHVFIAVLVLLGEDSAHAGFEGIEFGLEAGDGMGRVGHFF